MNSYKRLSHALARLDPTRITAGRELRGLTKKALAEKLQKTPSAITQFESGKSGLDVETFGALVMALGLPPSFFTERTNDVQVSFSTCHFRANRSVAQTHRRTALRHAVTVLEVFRSLESRGVRFPEPQVPTMQMDEYSPRQIEIAAQSVRKGWGLGDGPILDMCSLLEAMGVLVILLPHECEKIHAFSFWAEERPCVVIRESLSASHLQFDHGHELAHLVFHMEEAAGDLKSERIANHFAGAFLAPSASFRMDFPPRWNLGAFVDLKTRWHISIQAALYRGRQLNLISESRYRWATIDLSKRGHRMDEPGEFDKPLPSLLTKALELFKAELTLEELADDVGINERELEMILQSQKVPQELINSFKRSEAVDVVPKVTLLSPPRS